MPRDLELLADLRCVYLTLKQFHVFLKIVPHRRNARYMSAVLDFSGQYVVLFKFLFKLGIIFKRLISQKAVVNYRVCCCEANALIDDNNTCEITQFLIP